MGGYVETSVVGFDSVTGEAVEFETFDPELFEKMLEHYQEAGSAVAALTEAANDVEAEGDSGSYFLIDGETVFEEEKETIGASPFTDDDLMTAAALKGPQHNGEEEGMEEQEFTDMSLAMTGLGLFGVILFFMWYMLRSCKKGSDPKMFDPSNPHSRGRYRPAFNTNQNDDDDSEAVPQVELSGIEHNY